MERGASLTRTDAFWSGKETYTVMTQLYLDPPRSNARGPKPGGLVDTVNYYLPRGMRINHGDGVVVATVLVVLTLLVLLVANLQSEQVWLFGFNPAVPLSLQWLVSFAAGVICALRIQHVRATRTRANQPGNRR